MGEELLRVARRACTRNAWQDACATFGRADATEPLDAEDLDRWAAAAWLIGERERAESSWARAHRAWLDRSVPARAARCGFWLGLTLVLGGDHTRGAGWFARAGRVLERGGAGAVPDLRQEAAYLELPGALQTLHSGRAQEALAAFVEIARSGDDASDVDLAAFGRLGIGQARVALGDVNAGLVALDEAMLAVTDGEVSPLVAGIVYCASILTCRQAFDIRRAQQWTAALTAWCAEQQGIQAYRGECLVHRSELLQLGGHWAEALSEIGEARAHLARVPGDPVQGMACYQLGELLRLRGEFDRAEEAYRDGGAWGHTVQPGMALLRVAQGRVGNALAALRAVLADPQDPADRLRALAASVEVALAAGQPRMARQRLQELSAAGGRFDSEYLRAVGEHARGTVLLAEGHPEDALAALRASKIAWTALGAPYEAARTGMWLGAAYRDLDDQDSASAEWETARTQFTQVGAVTDLARLGELARVLPPGTDGLPPGTEEAPEGADGLPPGTEKPSAGAEARRRAGLTEREAQVLAHVAVGETNREIAAALVISEHTVRRHLQNVFAKLDVPSRAAATAWAYRHHLLPTSSP